MLPETLQRYVRVEELELRKERLQALIHWCGLYTMQQMEEVLKQQGQKATVTQMTAAIRAKQENRDIPAAWQETLSPPGTQCCEMLQRYDQLMGVS